MAIENNPEIMKKLAMFEPQIQGIQQQMQAIEQATMDLTSLSQGLEELNGKQGKEILAQIGRGIFVKAELLSEELVVDVGGKNFVKKNIKDTQKLIERQLEKLTKVQDELTATLEKINQGITEIILKEQGKEKSQEKGKNKEK